MERCGTWKLALIDIDRATEFVGDDVDRYSKLVDLGAEFDKLVIKIPTITSAAISVYVQKTPSEAEVPVGVYYRQPTDLATAAWADTAATTARSIVCDCLGGYQFVRIYSGANQAADRSIYVKGVN